MILYYAIGGGWGHVTRASAAIFTFRKRGILPKEQKVLILHSCKYISHIPMPGHVILRRVPHQLQYDLNLYSIWLKHILKKYQIQEIYLDTFPEGILKEWSLFPKDGESHNLPITFIARLLNIKNLIDEHALRYRYGFKHIYIVEHLMGLQLQLLSQTYTPITYIKLEYPPVDIEIPTLPPHTWLIVHSEPKEEIEELYLYGETIAECNKVTPNWLLISPTEVALDIPQWQFSPAHLLFPQAEKIFTACGFNAMQQTFPFREKHTFIPFERRFDNQFWRASVRNSIMKGGEDYMAKYSENK